MARPHIHGIGSCLGPHLESLDTRRSPRLMILCHLVKSGVLLIGSTLLVANSST